MANKSNLIETRASGLVRTILFRDGVIPLDRAIFEATRQIANEQFDKGIDARAYLNTFFHQLVEAAESANKVAHEQVRLSVELGDIIKNNRLIHLSSFMAEVKGVLEKSAQYLVTLPFVDVDDVVEVLQKALVKAFSTMHEDQTKALDHAIHYLPSRQSLVSLLVEWNLVNVTLKKEVDEE
jgi:hypothetical protein